MYKDVQFGPWTQDLLLKLVRIGGPSPKKQSHDSPTPCHASETIECSNQALCEFNAFTITDLYLKILKTSNICCL